MEWASFLCENGPFHSSLGRCRLVFSVAPHLSTKFDYETGPKAVRAVRGAECEKIQRQRYCRWPLEWQEFNTTDYEADMGRDSTEPDPPTCQYRAYRNSHNETKKYGLSPQYWHVFAARLAFVVVFEVRLTYIRRGRRLSPYGCWFLSTWQKTQPIWLLVLVNVAEDSAHMVVGSCQRSRRLSPYGCWFLSTWQKTQPIRLLVLVNVAEDSAHMERPPPVHPTEIRTSIIPVLISRAQHKRVSQLRHRGGLLAYAFLTTFVDIALDVSGGDFQCAHIVFALTGIMAYAIPDVPAEVRTQIQREKMLAREAKYEHGLRDPALVDPQELLERVRGSAASVGARSWWSRRLSRVSDVNLDNQGDAASTRNRPLNSSIVWETQQRREYAAVRTCVYTKLHTIRRENVPGHDQWCQRVSPRQIKLTDTVVTKSRREI
uniref:Uncharacterized protein n=1 Tax=Timema douglasi TaxID=61478 RepID=A0A7R8VM88_TIMDO|nr:unnamed protein product [Timema douglasi]